MARQKKTRQMVETYEKTVLKAGTGSSTPTEGARVTVHANLYLRDGTKDGQKGKAIWSTKETKGFLFPDSGKSGKLCTGI